MKINNEWVAAAWQTSLQAMLTIWSTIWSIPKEDIRLGKDDENGCCYFLLNDERFYNVNDLLKKYFKEGMTQVEENLRDAILEELADIFLFPNGCPECGSDSLQRERFIPTCYITSISGRTRMGSDLQDGLPEDFTLEERYYCPSCEMYFAERKWDTGGYLVADSTGILRPEEKTAVVCYDNEEAKIVSVKTFDYAKEAYRVAAEDANSFYVDSLIDSDDPVPEEEISACLELTGHWRRYEDTCLDWFVLPVS